MFYDRYCARVFGLVLKILHNRSDAEEALQETFWQVWQKAGDYDGSRACPRAWLFLLARSRSIDLLRRRPPTQAAEPDESAMADPCTAAPSIPLEADESAAAIRSALAQLTSEQAASINLAFFEGLTHVQLAQRLNVPLGTVKSRIRTGMQKLRALVEEAAA